MGLLAFPVGPVLANDPLGDRTMPGAEPGPLLGTDQGRQVAVFGVALIAGQVVSASTTPLFTRVLGPADFGALDVLTVVGTLLATVLLFGFDQAVVRSFYENRPDDARRVLVGSGFLFVMAASLSGCAVAVLFLPGISHLLLRRGGYEPVLLATLVGVPPFVGAAYLAEVLRLQGRPGPYAVSSMVRAVAGAAVGAVLVLAAHQGARGALLGLGAGSLVALAYGAVSARQLLRPVVRREPLQRMLRFGIPLVPSGVALWSLLVADRLILVRHVSLREIGLYALAAKIATLLLWAVNGFRAGWTASILEVHARDAQEAARRRSCALVDAVAVAVGLAAVLGGLAAELTTIGGGPGFEGATRIVPVLLLALVCFSTTPVTQSAMLIRYRTGLMAWHTGAAAVVNLSACLVLIPLWGVQGAAVATLLGFSYMAVGFYRSAQQIDPVDYRPARVMGLIALLVPYLVLGQVTVGPLALSVAVKLVCLSVLPTMLRRAGVRCPRPSQALSLVRSRLAGPPMRVGPEAPTSA